MLENFSVHQIISKIKKREIKIPEVVNFYLDRIKKFNPKLNAIISMLDEQKIIEDAKLKDKNFKSENQDDIYGLPIAVKELFDIKDEVTCYGYKELLKNISNWKEAPVWTPNSIKKATKTWFKLLSKS